MNKGFWRNVSWLLDQMVMAWAATWISLSLASHSLSYLSLLLFSLRFHFFSCFIWFCRFGLLDFFFFFTFFFLDLHRLLTRLGGCGSSVHEAKGAQVFFFFFGKFYLLKFFSLGPGEARAPLGPPPRSIPDFYSNSLLANNFFPTKI